RQNSFAYAAMVVGLTASVSHDVGGSSTDVGGALEYHGISSNDAKSKLDGMDFNTLNASGGGNNRSYHFNYLAMSETNLGLGSHSAEHETAGVQMNMIPKEGGNQFSFLGVAVYANGAMQGSNITDAVRARNFTTVGALVR